MLHFTMNMPFVLMAFYGSLMVVIILFLRRFLKDRLPKFVFPALWCVVLLRLLVPFSISSPLSVKIPADYHGIFSTNPIGFMTEQADTTVIEQVVVEDSAALGAGEKSSDAGVEGVVEEATAVYAGDGSSFYWDHTIFSLTVLLYYFGLFITAGILAVQKYGCTKKLKSSLLMEHNETINALLREMGMGHILVYTSDETASPLVCGLLAPRIYLPARMEFQNSQLLRHIFTHETMHIKRKDNWVKAVMVAALILHWFNPLVWIMVKCLSSDLEAACDEAVLGQYGDEDERKSYAYSLLAMAVTGNRTTMLYSAFSKTEVEKRIKSILNYKKASVLLSALAVAFLIFGTTVFATGVHAPFDNYLTSYCASSNSRWGVRVELTRDITMGKDPQKRAEDIVLDILRTDDMQDPEVIENKIKKALAEEFRVEEGAFRVDISLTLTEEEREEEWEKQGLIKDEQGYFLYQGEPVRALKDETGGFWMSREEGTVDISIRRNRYGEIEEVVVLREGDSEFDRRSKEIERERDRRTISGTGDALENTYAD